MIMRSSVPLNMNIATKSFNTLKSGTDINVCYYILYEP